MTKNWLEYDLKIFTMMNLIFLIWPKFATPTNINFSPSVWLGQVPQPRLASSHLPEHLPNLANPVNSLLYKKKTSGMEIRRTPDINVRFVGFIRLVSFNCGQVQLLRFIVVMVQSNSFGHLDSVQWITLEKNCFSVKNIVCVKPKN